MPSPRSGSDSKSRQRPSVHVWIRATLDWRDEAAFRAQVPERLRPRVELWDATFTLPYHEVRAELRAIAADSLAGVRAATFSEWDAIPDGALVLPVDDDDWFAPEVAEVAAAQLGDREGVRWTSTFLERPIDAVHLASLTGRRLLPGVGQKWVCTTNNYALVKRAGRREIAADHSAMSRWVEEDRSRVAWLDRRLSVMNRSPASQTVLNRRRMDRAGLLRKRRAYARLYRRFRAEGDLAWAAPYVARMAALMERLAPR